MAEWAVPVARGRVVAAEPYRNPEILLPLIQDLTRYTFYFVMTHGELMQNNEPYRFYTPENTMILQTGGGETAGCLVMTSLDEYLLPRFQPSQIRQTFETFLGLRGNIRDDTLAKMIFNTPSIGPSDVTLNKFISLSQDDVDNPEQLWGVFKLVPHLVTPGLAEIEEDPQLTTFILNTPGLTEEDFVRHVQTTRGTATPTLFFFVNCPATDIDYDPADYSGSLMLATQPTHYSRRNVTERQAGLRVIKGGPRERPTRFESVAPMTAAERRREVNLGQIISPRAEEGNRSHTFNTLLEAAYPNSNSNTETKGCIGVLCRLLKGRRRKKTAGGKRKAKKKHATRKRSST